MTHATYQFAHAPRPDSELQVSCTALTLYMQQVHMFHVHMHMREDTDVSSLVSTCIRYAYRGHAIYHRNVPMMLFESPTHMQDAVDAMYNTICMHTNILHACMPGTVMVLLFFLCVATSCSAITLSAFLRKARAPTAGMPHNVW